MWYTINDNANALFPGKKAGNGATNIEARHVHNIEKPVIRKSPLTSLYYSPHILIMNTMTGCMPGSGNCPGANAASNASGISTMV